MAAMRRNNKSTSTSTLVLTLVTGAFLGAASLAGCGEDAIPERPSYARDIKPLMEAHCIRCHGAGGTLNIDPDVPADFKTAGGQQIGGLAPTYSYFTSLENPGAGQFGLLAYTDSGALHAAMTTYLPYMPPPPADPLTDRELKLFKAWLANPLP